MDSFYRTYLLQQDQKQNRLMRLPEVLAITSMGKSKWWQGVKDEIYPKPIKLGGRATFWKSQDIYNLIQGTTS